MAFNLMSREEISNLREEYPKGTRIKLIHMKGEEERMVTGLLGVVRYVDDAGQIGVAWDNGSSLALVPEVDRFCKVVE